VIRFYSASGSSSAWFGGCETARWGGKPNTALPRGGQEGRVMRGTSSTRRLGTQQHHNVDFAGFLDRCSALIEQLWHRSQGVEPRDIGVQPRPIPRPPALCKPTGVRSRSEPLLYSADLVTKFFCPSTHPSSGVQCRCCAGGTGFDGPDPARRLGLSLPRRTATRSATAAATRPVAQQGGAREGSSAGGGGG
jgi:hypothetical protein